MNYYLISITYFFIFFPYLTISGIFNSDVQPFAGIFAAGYIITNLHRVKFNTIAFLLIFLTLIAAAYNILDPQGFRQTFKFLAIPYSCVLYIFIHNTIDRVDISKLAFRYGVIYCFFCFFQFILPSLYVIIFSNFLRVIKIKELGGMRGISTLTTEPSFTAVILLIIFAIVYYTKNDIPNIRKKLLYLMIIISIFLTKSLTGVMLLLLFLAWELIKNARFVYIISISLVFILCLNLFHDARAVGFLKLAFTSPMSVLSASSLFFRVYYFVYGFIALSHNTFGASLGSLSMHDIRLITDQIFVDSVPYHTLIRIHPSINMPSTFGANSYIYGLFYFIFYVLVFIPIYLRKEVPFQIKIFIFVLTAQSFSFSFTFLWLLVALSYKKIFVREEKLSFYETS